MRMCLWASTPTIICRGGTSDAMLDMWFLRAGGSARQLIGWADRAVTGRFRSRALRDFYGGPGARFVDAAADFFKQMGSGFR